MIACTFLPSGVFAFIAARKISPVEICGMPYAAETAAAKVPFPAPGGPQKIKFIRAPVSLGLPVL